MDAPLALDTDQAKAIGIGAIVAFILVGAVLSLVISALIGRLITIVVAVVLVAVVWSQRADIQSAAKNCDATFFGVHLTPSNPDVKARCQQVTNR